jgi:hypothetical protein
VIRRLTLLVLVITCLAMSPAPKPVKVAIPADGGWCLDGPVAPDGSWSASTKPVLYGWNGRARLGPVTPGTCALIDGDTAKTVVSLRCDTTQAFSPAAVWATTPGGAALCLVPADQDFSLP